MPYQWNDCLKQPLHAYLETHAANHPDKAALIYYGARMSWAELDRASKSLAAYLQSCGVKKGSHVVLYMNNCPQYVVAHYAVQRIGAVVCPASSLFKVHELEYQVGDLEALTIIAASDLVPVVEAVREKNNGLLTHRIVVHYADMLPEAPTLRLPKELEQAIAAPRSVPEGWHDYREIVAQDKTPAKVQVSLDDVALITYTSGSTGMPKGAMLTYGNALYKTVVSATGYRVSQDSVTLVIPPLYHIAGMLMGVCITVLTGATCVLLYRFDPVAVLQAIDKYKVSWWYSMTPMNLECMRQLDIADYDLSSLKFNPVTSFGVIYNEAIANQWKQYVPSCQTQELAYGLSETHTCDTYMPPERVKWGTHGVAMPGTEIRIVDPETGAPVPNGTMGEITLRSPGNFIGYLRKPEATAKTLRDGWVHTGDMGTLDDDGYMTFVGREKEMIKVSGYSVFPEEVERILVKHERIEQAAVVGVPDETKGEVVKAYLVINGKEQPSKEDLIAWARDNMALYKAPKYIEYIDQMPTTGSGKVLRRLLTKD